MNKQEALASAQILAFSPIREEAQDVREKYFAYLRGLVKILGWEKRRYSKAQLAFYKENLCEVRRVPRCCCRVPFDVRFCYLIPFDLAIVLGFDPHFIRSEKVEVFIQKIVSEFDLDQNMVSFFTDAFSAAWGDTSAWDKALAHDVIKPYEDYLMMVRKNTEHVQKKPYNVLVTATMSAGKSTLINALVGKRISRAQNTACTSKIHTILSKPFEDGVISESDHQLSIDATKEELLNDNANNNTQEIVVATYFDSELAGERIVLLDSPGVNSSENPLHAAITERMIKSRKYQLMLYVINAAQLDTCDERAHWKLVKERIGRRKILFVINQVDRLLSEDDDLEEVISRQRKYLHAMGFKNPVICPVSARAAYLVQKSFREKLSRAEQRDIGTLMDKFESHSMAEYYEGEMGCSPVVCENEMQELLKNCGLIYLERIIKEYSNRR